MAQGNTTTQIGNITRDPELRFTPGGMAVSSFGLAVNQRRQDRQTQEWIERTSFFDVVAYGSLAENVAESLQRGSRVIVDGRLEQRSWETQDGEKRSKVEIIADDIGPSLRWATADVTKNERRGGDDYQPAQRPARTASNVGGGNQAPAYDYDDEPFVLDAFAEFDRYGHGLTKWRP